VKGPTAAFMHWSGLPLSSAGVAAAYDGLLDGLVADERTTGLPVLETGVLMDTEGARRQLASRRCNSRSRSPKAIATVH